MVALKHLLYYRTDPQKVHLPQRGLTGKSSESLVRAILDSIIEYMLKTWSDIPWANPLPICHHQADRLVSVTGLAP